MLSYPLRWLAPGVLSVWLSLAGGPAWAHAVTLASTPAVNAIVAGTELPIKFPLDSRIGRERPCLERGRVDGSSIPLTLAADSEPESLAAMAIGFAPSQYRRRWQVLSVDGHITRRDIPFQTGEAAR